MTEPYDAVVLAGGGARRLGGVDKPGLEVGGRTLLDRVLAAVSDAGTVVVVGASRPTVRPVVWAREDPPGGGPAAALAAGLAHVTADTVVVLAADLPFLDVATVAVLRAAAQGADGAVLVDDEGRDQVLTSCWSTVRLRDRAVGDLHGQPLRAVLRGLVPVRLPAPDPRAVRDVDTPEDLARALTRRRGAGIPGTCRCTEGDASTPGPPACRDREPLDRLLPALRHRRPPARPHLDGPARPAGLARRRRLDRRHPAAHVHRMRRHRRRRVAGRPSRRSPSRSSSAAPDAADLPEQERLGPGGGPGRPGRGGPRRGAPRRRPAPHAAPQRRPRARRRRPDRPVGRRGRRRARPAPPRRLLGAPQAPAAHGPAPANAARPRPLLARTSARPEPLLAQTSATPRPLLAPVTSPPSQERCGVTPSGGGAGPVAGDDVAAEAGHLLALRRELEQHRSTPAAA